jgi:F-box/leucine-rich repeat protein 14
MSELQTKRNTVCEESTNRRVKRAREDNRNWLSALPAAVISTIASYLPLKSHVCVLSTSKSIRKDTLHSSAWNKMCTISDTVSGMDFPSFGEWACSIRFLDVNVVHLNDHHLNLLSTMHRLEHLRIVSSYVTDTGIGHIQNLPLVHFALVSDQLGWYVTDISLGHLSRMCLQHLEITGLQCPFTDDGFVHLSGMPLRFLNIGCCAGVTDIGFAKLLQGSVLEHLELGGCYNMTDMALCYLDKLPLRTLKLMECCQLTDNGLARLAHQQLETIVLSDDDAPFTDTGLEHFATLTKLQHLSLNASGINGEGLRHICNAPITRLKLGVNRVSLEAMNYIQRLPLRHLELYDTTDAHMSFLRCVQSLRHLQMWSCSDLTDAGVAFISELPLEYLEITIYEGPSLLTDASLECIGAMTTLRELRLDGHENFTDKGLFSLYNLHALQKLSICTHTSTCSDDGMARLRIALSIQ